MKKIYFLLIGFVWSVSALHAQLILTKAFNEPVPGDVFSEIEYDSTALVPRATGNNQTWNFSSCTQSTLTASASFSASAAVPQASLFPGTNLIQYDAAGTYTMFKVSTTPTTQVEMLGFYDITNSAPSIFTNSAIFYKWPIATGTTYSDTFAGTIDMGNNTTAPLTGTITTLGSGSGNIVLPGGSQLNNVLQVKSDLTLRILFSIPPITFTQTVKETLYQYYHGSQKFPLLTQFDDKITLASILGPTVDVGFGISVNQNVAVGITDQNYNAQFQIVPNPAQDVIQISFNNQHNEPVEIRVFNALGQAVKVESFGKDTRLNTLLDIRDLPPGWYTVQTRWGTQTALRKLLVN